MDQCVTNNDVDRVLIICDKSYAEKANSRNDGVGDETVIISPEIYGQAKQEKFIPVIIEVDEDNKPFLPAYIKSRIYIDISGENYEEGYEKLLRTLYGQLESRKPAFGSPPAFLFKEENASLLTLKDAIRKLEAHDFRRVNKNTADKFLDDFRAIKENRNCFLKFIKILAESNKLALGEFLAGAFEHIYNTLCDINFFAPQACSCYDANFNIFKLHIWELFLCSMTYLLHHERKFCEKLFCLFDVQSIDSLKQKISKCRNKPAIGYDNVTIPASTYKALH